MLKRIVFLFLFDGFYCLPVDFPGRASLYFAVTTNTAQATPEDGERIVGVRIPSRHAEAVVRGLREMTGVAKLQEAATRVATATLVREGEAEEGAVAAIPAEVFGAAVAADEAETALIGRYVRKAFGADMFEGKVTCYDSESELYEVTYDDGDEETMHLGQ